MSLASPRRLFSSLLGSRPAEKDEAGPVEAAQARKGGGEDSAVALPESDASVDSRIMDMLAKAPGFKLERLLILDLECLAEALPDPSAKAMGRIDKLAIQLIGESLGAKDRAVPLGPLRHMLIFETADATAARQTAGRLLREMARRLLGDHAGETELWYEVVERGEEGDLTIQVRSVAPPGSAEAVLEEALEEEGFGAGGKGGRAARDSSAGPGAISSDLGDPGSGDGAEVDDSSLPPEKAAAGASQTDLGALMSWLDDPESDSDPDWGQSQERAETDMAVLPGSYAGKLVDQDAVWTPIPGSGEPPSSEAGLGVWKPIAHESKPKQEGKHGPKEVTNPRVLFEPIYSPRVERVVGYRAVLEVTADGQPVRLDEDDLGLPLMLLDRMDERLHRQALACLAQARSQGKPASLSVPVRLSYLQRAANARRFFTRITSLPDTVRALVTVEVIGLSAHSMTINAQVPFSALKEAVRELTFAMPLSGGPFPQLAAAGATGVTLTGFADYRTSKAMMVAEPSITRAKGAGLKVWVSGVHSRFAMRVLGGHGVNGLRGSVVAPAVEEPYGQMPLEDLRTLIDKGTLEVDISPT